MTTPEASPSLISPRARPVVRALFGALALIYLLVALVGFALYWQDGQQICVASQSDCQSRLQFTTDQAAAFAAQGIPFLFMVVLRYVGLAGGAIAYILVGLLIAWRRSDNWMTLFTALFLISYAGSNGAVTGTLTRIIPSLTGLVLLLNSLWALLFIWFLALFPNGRLTPTWLRFLLPILSVMLIALSLGSWDAGAQSPLFFLLAAAIVLMFASLMAAQVIRYRRYATSLEREQVKWALLGIVVVLSLLMTGVVLTASLPSTANLLLAFLVGFAAFNLGPALLPIFIGLAILRSRLWDIDILIRRTLIYSSLTTLLALFYFGSVTLLQQLLSAASGPRSDVAIIVSTLAIAGLFIPLRSRLQDFIDRRFYRRKYNAAHVLETFAATLRDEVDLSRLTDELQAVVSETMEPESVSVWLRNPSK